MKENKLTEITIVSGKGGAGKTSLVAALVKSSPQPLLAVDADVDAANLALLLSGNDVREEDFVSGRGAVIDEKMCLACEACIQVCRFEALEPDPHGIVTVKPYLCEGCGRCLQACPAGAVTMVEQTVGKWFFRHLEEDRQILLHAQLGIGQDNSGKLVAHLRDQARQAAQDEKYDLILVDGPPGIGCPVHAAITGANLLVVVVEPSISGLHDAGRMLETAEHFSVPAVIVHNKAGLTPGDYAGVDALARKHNVDVIGRIPFRKSISAALAKQQTLLDAGPEISSVVTGIRHACMSYQSG